MAAIFNLPLITYPILVTACFGILVFLVGHFVRGKYTSKLLGLISSVGLLFTVYFVIEAILSLRNGTLTVLYYYGTPPPIGSCLEVDFFSLAVALLASFLGLMVTIYSIKYMEHDNNLNAYYSLLLFLIAAVIGVAFAGDLLTLFVFYELMGVTSYSLVAFYKEKAEPIEAAIKYLIMGAIGSAVILYAFSLIYGLTGTLNIAYVANYFRSAAPQPFSYVILILLIGGFGVKAAIVPMHSWLIDAHPSAPSGISAMLSGVVIKGGLYAMIRTTVLFFPVSTYMWNYLLATIAIVTIFLANIIAIVQKDLKRLLAYSSIFNIGLIVLAFSLGTEFGLAAGIFHILNHGIMKGLAFMCAGVILHTIGTRNLDEMKGIARKMPVTGVLFAIALLGLAGVPPLSGFMSKFLIIFSAVQLSNTYGYLLAAIALINSIFATLYYAKVIKVIWMDEPGENVANVHEASWVMVLPLALLALLIVIVGIWPQLLYDLAYHAAENLINAQSYINNGM